MWLRSGFLLEIRREKRVNKFELIVRTKQFAIIFVSLSKALKNIIIMTDIQLYTKLAGLPLNLKNEVADFYWKSAKMFISKLILSGSELK